MKLSLMTFICISSMFVTRTFALQRSSINTIPSISHRWLNMIITSSPERPASPLKKPKPSLLTRLKRLPKQQPFIVKQEEEGRNNNNITNYKS